MTVKFLLPVNKVHWIICFNLENFLSIFQCHGNFSFTYHSMSFSKSPTYTTLTFVNSKVCHGQYKLPPICLPLFHIPFTLD